MRRVRRSLIAITALGVMSGCNPEPDNISGEFFRFTVNVIYKGEPLRIEYPAACNYNISRNIDGSRSVDGATYAPAVFGVKAPDGGALVIKTPIFCDFSKEIDAGTVTSDYNPLIVHYENAEKPWFGMGYYAPEAFKSSHSIMKFVSSNIQRISGDEYVAWRESNPHANWVTYERMNANSNIFERTVWKPGDRHLATVCRGATLYPLSQEARGLIKDAWEDLGKPKYWSDKNKQLDVWRIGYMPNKQQSFGQKIRKKYGYDGNHDKGIVYPSETDYDMNRTDATGKIITKAITHSKNYYAIRDKIERVGVRANIVADDNLRGFLFCNSHDNEHVSIPSLEIAYKDLRGGVYQINGIELHGKEGLIPHPYWPLSWRVFIEDNYIVSNAEIRFFAMGGKL